MRRAEKQRSLSIVIFHRKIVERIINTATLTDRRRRDRVRVCFAIGRGEKDR